MGIRIRAVTIEDEPLAAQYLGQNCWTTPARYRSSVPPRRARRACAQLRPDAAFVDINLLARSSSDKTCGNWAKKKLDVQRLVYRLSSQSRFTNPSTERYTYENGI